MERIDINFINISNDNFFTNSNNKIIIKIYNEYENNIYSNEFYVKYDMKDNLISKQYYITIGNLNKSILTTDNFILQIENFKYEYTYYDNQIEKSLIIFNRNNYFQLIYLGLPNNQSPIDIMINYDSYNINMNVITNSQSITLSNNYQGILNYLQNTIYLDGSIYKIIINNIISSNPNISTNYKLFHQTNTFNLDLNTFIYFYNDISTLSYILYLNCYNFIDNKVFPENYESIIIMIDYSLNEDIIYSLILSLNLQTFNTNQIDPNSILKYYNVLFFNNLTNPNYIIKNITIFDYDYEKYFINTLLPPEYYNIQGIESNLYSKIIESDSMMNIPEIIDLSYSYLLINLNLIDLVNLIHYNCENHYFNVFMKSNKITIDTLVAYLVKFELKSYNIYKITNLEHLKPNNNELFKNKNKEKYYYNYNYNDSNNLNKRNHYQKNIININNNIINSIKCKIIFLFGIPNLYSYSFDAKLFLNNYNIEIYHKNYQIDSIDKKKKLILLLLFIASKSIGIKIIFYNQQIINPQSIISPDNLTIYNMFNQIELFKSMNDFNIFFDIISINSNYTKQFLKCNINIKKDYYILFLYSDINSILSTYTKLQFVFSQYSFTIFKLDTINGNFYQDKELFYIGFNNLKDINIFMSYITTGLFIDKKYNELKNYFNIPKSIYFSNYYNINDFWIESNLPPPTDISNNPNNSLKNEIYFSINNLSLNQIYLYGNISINQI